MPMKYLITVLMMLYGAGGQAQKINQNWNSQLEEAISQFKTCENTTVAGVNSCNDFIGETLKTIYRVNDFYSVADSRYMLVSEIYAYLQNSKRWTLLGKAYEQETLSSAQKLANEKRAVVAIYLNESNIGQLAYILPGSLQPSGTWGFQVPNSAAYFIDKPEGSYTNKGLSYSFPRNAIQSVLLYTRAY